MEVDKRPLQFLREDILLSAMEVLVLGLPELPPLQVARMKQFPEPVTETS